jgi:crotonobetainyl-CoA:carnitine CoA-transferase CaiB-like acyl-CoA transferase
LTERSAVAGEPLEAGALAGLKVLDLTDRAGALGARLLGDLGADVVRVEPPGGATLRQVENADAYYGFNKRCVLIDAATAAGAARLARLAAAADVVIDGRPPDAAPTLHELCGGRSASIRVRITPFGADGPRAPWLGGDLVCAARGGMVFVNGAPGEPPLQPFGLAAYTATGLFAAIATLLALHTRKRCGRGGEVDLAVQAAAAAAVEHATGLFRQSGEPPRRQGALHWSRSFRIGRAADGHLLHGLLGDWTSLVEWVASDSDADLLRDPRWELPAERKDHCELLFDRLDDWAGSLPVAEAIDGAWARRLAYAPVRSPRDLAEDVQLAARGFLVETGAGAERVVLPGAPFRLSRTPWRFRRPAALPGAHDAEVDADPSWDSPARVEREPRSQSALPAQGSRPLDGIVVLDFTWVVAGPVTTRILADHGARVIKVEHPQAPDFGSRRGGLSGNLNRGKESIVLDMTRASARRVAAELAAQSDVVIDNFSARVLRSWGLDDDSLRALRRDLVIVHMAGFGRDGPLGDQVSYGPTLQAMVGLPRLMPSLRGEPIGWGYSWSDMVAGIGTALATLAALWHRSAHGEGQVIDAGQYETLTALLGPGVLAALAARDPLPPGNGSQEGEAVPHGVFRCAGELRADGAVDRDRWVAIAVASEAEWARLAAVLASAGERWASAPRFATLPGRAAARREIESALERWTRERRASEVEDLLQGAGVPAGLVANGADLEADEQLAWRGYFAALETVEGARERFDGVPFRSTIEPGQVSHPGPLLGEHTERVLTDLLGLDGAAIATLRAEGAIG